MYIKSATSFGGSPRDKYTIMRNERLKKKGNDSVFFLID